MFLASGPGETPFLWEPKFCADSVATLIEKIELELYSHSTIVEWYLDKDIPDITYLRVKLDEGETVWKIQQVEFLKPTPAQKTPEPFYAVYYSHYSVYKISASTKDLAESILMGGADNGTCAPVGVFTRAGICVSVYNLSGDFRSPEDDEYKHLHYEFKKAVDW